MDFQSVFLRLPTPKNNSPWLYLARRPPKFASTRTWLSSPMIAVASSSPILPVSGGWGNSFSKENEAEPAKGFSFGSCFSGLHGGRASLRTRCIRRRLRCRRRDRDKRGRWRWGWPRHCLSNNSVESRRPACNQR